jgi:pyridoxamine 5'-phosphate oxidase
VVKTYKGVEYKKLSLLEPDILINPFDQLSRWWQEATSAGDPVGNAVYLATVDHHSHPDARIVLLKSFDESGLVFFTNYESQKGQQLNSNPHACLVIFWPTLERQIRIRGAIKKTSRTQSEQYFKSRPRGAQIGTWTSAQSQIIENRHALDQAFSDMTARFKEEEIPCPLYWGGYRLIPDCFEFWQGRQNRLHDRIFYQKDNNEHWCIKRLAP